MSSKKIIVIPLLFLLLLGTTFFLYSLYKQPSQKVTAQFIGFSNNLANEQLALIQVSNSSPHTIMLIDSQPPEQFSFLRPLFQSYSLNPGEQAPLILTITPGFTNGAPGQLIFFRQPSRFESFALLPWTLFHNTTSIPPRLIIPVDVQIPNAAAR
jgi:hypothetical protein